MNDDRFIIILGGQVFFSLDDCAEQLGIPYAYVEHMLMSYDYPGCIAANVCDDQVVSFLQTFSIMKSMDAR